MKMTVSLACTSFVVLLFLTFLNAEQESKVFRDDSLLLRKRRAPEDNDADQQSNFAYQQDYSNNNLQPVAPEQHQAARNRLAELMNSRYMPSQEQLIQLLVLVAVIALGPMLGPLNASAVEGIVRQVLPIVVSTALNFASQHNDAASEASNHLHGAPASHHSSFQTQPLSPVQPQSSMIRRAI